MKKIKFAPNQIFMILKEWESGAAIEAVSRSHGVSTATLYSWRGRYGGMEIGNLKRLTSLEEENTMKALLTILVLLIGQLTYGQSVGKYVSNPENSSLTSLKLKRNHSFTYISNGQIAEPMKQSGKWKIENDTLILYDIRQSVYRVGLFEMPTKWTVSENEICGIPKMKLNFHLCLRQEW